MSELSYEKELNIERYSNNEKSGELSKIIYYGKVIENYDEKNLQRLTVRIDGIDNGIEDKDIPLSYPFNSKVGINILPKKGEVVKILISDLTYTNKKANRLWIGPIISNYENILEEKYLFGDNILQTDLTKSKIAKNNRSYEKDIFPTSDEDVSILGRDNSDIILGKNKVTLRAGKHKKNKPREKNTVNPTYSILEYISDESSYGLTVGDTLFFISHNGKEKFKRILTAKDIVDLKENSQSMLYGELTIDYLKTLTEFVFQHTHNHAQTSPVKSKKFNELMEKLNNIEKLLAKNLKIN